MYSNLLLGEAIGRRTYGYELVSRLRAVNELFGLTESSVYSCINQLEKRRLLETIEERTGPEHWKWRKRIQATDRGVEYYRSWMESPERRRPIRESIHMQMLVATDDDIPVLIKTLDQLIDDCEKQIANVFELTKEMAATDAVRNEFAVPLVRRAFLGTLATDLEWAQMSRAELAERAIALGGQRNGDSE
ncbi:PadR family transcriptional regulator [Conexibacter stalactiti]|uniref:PadR family transcriptional regulator n=1 Tax=Conexibacter stalactiti TaxID=1940611 RepID=A0ABU4HJI0_9ACTN|nr:PadR family transcriptional regulator [Conexibacter stalactiti]MDW5593468.1 PadR family transcriptional regulator [Conexibacter stalactiti]MEC5034109.1 PadR family transcriptional regulator [Conexibacter stalactiti]